MDMRQLYRQSEDYFFRGISTRCKVFWDEAVAYMTEIPLADLNFAYIINNPDSFDEVLRQIKRFYFLENLPFVVIIPENFCTSLITDAFKDNGYFLKNQTYSMFMDLSSVSARKSDPADEIIVQNMSNKLTDWTFPLTGAFETTSSLINVYKKLHKSALRRGINFYHFSLYVNGVQKPISSSTLSICNNNAMVNDIGTVPKFQGRGYGTRLLRHLLSEAQKLGVNYCFLESSESGLSLYRRCGFNTLFKNNTFILREK